MPNNSYPHRKLSPVENLWMKASQVHPWLPAGVLGSIYTLTLWKILIGTNPILALVWFVLSLLYLLVQWCAAMLYRLLMYGVFFMLSVCVTAVSIEGAIKFLLLVVNAGRRFISGESLISRRRYDDELTGRTYK